MQHFSSEDIKIGDWVMGQEQLMQANVLGFVENIDFAEGTLYIHVTDSDQDELLGFSTFGSISDFIEIGDEGMEGIASEGEIKNLIDIALDEKNFEWCKLLLTHLHFIQGSTKSYTNYDQQSYHRV